MSALVFSRGLFLFWLSLMTAGIFGGMTVFEVDLEMEMEIEIRGYLEQDPDHPLMVRCL